MLPVRDGQITRWREYQDAVAIAHALGQLPALLGGPARLWDSDPSVPSAVVTDKWFMGVWTRRFLFEYPTWTRLVGVHFKPWGMSPFTGIPANELRDRWVPADAVWQRSLDRIRNRVGEAASATGALRALEEELRSRLDFLQAQLPPGATRSCANAQADSRRTCWARY